MTQLVVKLDAAQLAGATVSLREYHRSKERLDQVIESILHRAEIKDALEWGLNEHEGTLIVQCPDTPPPTPESNSDQILKPEEA